MKYEDKAFLKHFLHVMDGNYVILDGRKKNEQKMELLVKQVEIWIKQVEDGDPNAVTEISTLFFSFYSLLTY